VRLVEILSSLALFGLYDFTLPPHNYQLYDFTRNISVPPRGGAVKITLELSLHRNNTW